MANWAASLGSRVRDVSSPVRLHQEYSIQSQVFPHLFLITLALLQENLIQIKGFVLHKVKETWGNALENDF